MSLLEKSKKDMITAMKKQDKEKLIVLRMIKGALQLESINTKTEATEELFIDVVGKQIKLRNDSITEFAKGNRQDLIEQAEKEIAILKEYLPEQLSEIEISSIIDIAIQNVKPSSPKDMGLVMKEVTPLVKGKADMKVVSSLIKAKLENL
jgi:Uncharacterized conserved protein